MSNPGYTASPSYFWSCLTLADDCPFFSSVDPNLLYFGVGLLYFYVAFMLILLTEFVISQPLENLQNQIDYYVNLIKTKIQRVQTDQKKLMSTQERTEKQLKRTLQGQKIIKALRGAIVRNDQQEYSVLTSAADNNMGSANNPTLNEYHM